MSEQKFEDPTWEGLFLRTKKRIRNYHPIKETLDIIEDELKNCFYAKGDLELIFDYRTVLIKIYILGEIKIDQNGQCELAI